MDIKVSKGKCNSVHPPFLLWGGGGHGVGWASYQIFKKGGTWQNLNFERGLQGKRGDFFQGVEIAEIFNDRKLYKKCFSVS